MTDHYYPSLGSGLPGHAALINSTREGKEIVLDQVNETIFVCPRFTTTDTFTSVGTGGAAVTEINSSGVTGFLFDADDEVHETCWRLPADIDMGKAISIRFLALNSAANASGETYQLIPEALPLTAETTAIATAEGGTAVDTQADAQESAGSYVPQWTGWSTWNAATLSATLVPGVDALVLSCKCDLTTLTDCYLIAGEVKYYRSMVG